MHDDTRERHEAMLDAMLDRWDEFLAQTARHYEAGGLVARPPHGDSVFDTARVRWNPIELALWLNLVPSGHATISRRSGAHVRRHAETWLGHLPITLEAADGTLMDAERHIRFELRLVWRHDALGWSLVGVEPDHEDDRRQRRLDALVAETDPFVAAVRQQLVRQDADAGAILAEVKDSPRTTRPELLAVLVDDDADETCQDK